MLIKVIKGTGSPSPAQTRDEGGNQSGRQSERQLTSPHLPKPRVRLHIEAAAAKAAETLADLMREAIKSDEGLPL